MIARMFQELDVWEDLDVQRIELIVGGTVQKIEDNPYNGVPFGAVVTPGKDVNNNYVNLNGYTQSKNAIPQAYGAPLVNNVG